MIIPYREISEDALDNLIEYYVLREGTDYGEQELSLAQKVQAVKRQLHSGDVVIVYSELHESINLMSNREFLQQQAE